MRMAGRPSAVFWRAIPSKCGWTTSIASVWSSTQRQPEERRRLRGIRFDVRNRDALERDALRQAVADARARAEAAATGAGPPINSVVRIEEAGAPVEPPRPMMRMAAAAEQAVSTPVAPSTIEIHSRVTLTASLR